jgi:serine/threonine protein kinase
MYHLTGEVLGQGAYASVRTCKDIWTDKEFAVKIIDKVPGHSRYTGTSVIIFEMFSAQKIGDRLDNF